MWRFFIGLILAVGIVSCAGTKLTQSEEGNARNIVGYIFARDTLLNGNDINVKDMTEINYAFANIVDGKISQGFKYDTENFKILNQTRTENPDLKILISVGGWEWSGGFSDMSLTKASRKKFIRSAIAFVEENNLDGIDIDWEYPNQIGNGNTYRPEDKEDFTSLLRELRSALHELGTKTGKHYLISIAAGASKKYLANTEMSKVQKYVDYINLMTYDFYVPGADSISGFNAPLFTNPRDPHHGSDDAIVQDFIADGVSPQKLVLGVPFYGHVFQVDSTSYNGRYEPAGIPSTRIRGTFANLVQHYINKNGFVRYWDSTSCVPYLFNPVSRIFITYEDQESLRDKCDFIKARGLKGVMFWEYNADYKGKLLQTLYDGLR